MLILLIALLSGLIFSFGLLISGMANPQKVLGFLDITGAWDPSLILVMVGAILVSLAPFQWANKQARSLLGEPMQLPQKRHIQRELIIGSALFGIGWGLLGVCPGPALVLVGLMQSDGLWFVMAMLVGMLVFNLLLARGNSNQ
jgi:uncharacterized membrane protein YedE/YeeE